MIISRTPLRISFFGGGSDIKEFWEMNSGEVISTAINKYVYVIVKRRFDNKIYVSTMEKEVVDNVNEIKNSIIRECMKMVGITKGVEIAVLSDIPSSGSGLGSSSAFTVGILNALYTLKNKRSPRAYELAKKACEIEIDILGAPIGWQDQFAAAFGGTNIIRFNRNGITDVIPVQTDTDILERLNRNLMAFYTNIPRQAKEILSEQKESLFDKSIILCKMRDQVKTCLDILYSGKIDKFGALLNEAWLMKRNLASKISSDVIDAIYSKGLEAGALGGKICGAGGGGFILFYCPEEKQELLRKSLNNLRELKFLFEPNGSQIIFNGGE